MSSLELRDVVKRYPSAGDTVVVGTLESAFQIDDSDDNSNDNDNDDDRLPPGDPPKPGEQLLAGAAMEASEIPLSVVQGFLHEVVGIRHATRPAWQPSSRPLPERG